MIRSAERALDEVRDSMTGPAPRAEPRRVAVPLAPSPAKRSMRWLGAGAFAGSILIVAAMVLWPLERGIASNGSAAPIIDAALAAEQPELLTRQNTTDAIGRLYAAEFARSDAASMRCLAEAIYYEARGEAYLGQVAVAQVVLNRARSGKWPRNICAVVNQGIARGEKCQFSYACRVTRTPPHGAMWDQAQEIAIDAVKGRVWLRELVEATHYHTTDVAPVWRQGLDGLGTFGMHVFYRTPELGYVLAIATASEPRADGRSLEATSAVADAPLDFKLLPSPAAAKPRQPLRHTRAPSDTAANVDAPKPAADWARDLQTR